MPSLSYELGAQQHGLLKDEQGAFRHRSSQIAASFPMANLGRILRQCAVSQESK